jgi:Fe-S cluster assembly protein SufD
MNVDVGTYRSSHHAWAEGAHEQGWLRTLRERGLDRFEALGFPAARSEAWRYTSTRKLAAVPFVHAEAAGDAAALEAMLAPHRIEGAIELVFVNGALRPELGRSNEAGKGVLVTPLSSALAGQERVLQSLLGSVASVEAESFTALNQAFFQDGVFLQLTRRASGAAPVHLLFVAVGDGGPVVAHPRNLVLADAGSQATLVETHLGVRGEATLCNSVTEVLLRAGASLDHQVLGLGAVGQTLVHTVEVRQERDSKYHLHASWLGGTLTRSNVRVKLVGPGAEATLDGLYLLDGDQHVDNHTILDHMAPRCTSRETYKGVLGGRSKGVFDGLIVVRPDAQHTDAAQSNRNLLLSDTAEADTKPQLEIYADDVKCAHGTTVGQLDAEQLWYLRSRGVPLDLARQLLTSAFVHDVVGTLADVRLRERLEGIVNQRLAELQVEGR